MKNWDKLSDEGCATRAQILSCGNFLEKYWYAAGKHGDEVDEEEGAAAVLVAEVGKAPNVAEADRDRDAAEEKVELVSPSAPLVVVVLEAFDKIVLVDLVALGVCLKDFDVGRVDNHLASALRRKLCKKKYFLETNVELYFNILMHYLYWFMFFIFVDLVFEGLVPGAPASQSNVSGAGLARHGATRISSLLSRHARHPGTSVGIGKKSVMIIWGVISKVNLTNITDIYSVRPFRKNEF